MSSAKFSFTVSIEGIPFKIDWNPKIDGVLLDMRESGVDRKKVHMATVEVECEPQMRRILAVERIDKALSKIAFALGHSIKRGNEEYETILEPKFDKPRYGWGWHKQVRRGVIFRPVARFYAVVDYQTILETALAKINNVKPEKRIILTIALALYREALGIESPNIALIVFFSSITAIVRDTKSNHVLTSDLKKALQVVAKMEDDKFSQYFEELYGNAYGRSATDHGRVDITDPLVVGNATMYVNTMRYWTKSIIQNYIDANQTAPSS